jgi:hypothetical protein
MSNDLAPIDDAADSPAEKISIPHLLLGRAGRAISRLVGAGLDMPIAGLDRITRGIKSKKQHGEKIEPRKGESPSKVINLMDALRRSAKGDSARPAERAPARRAKGHAKKATRSTARHRKAG